MLFCLTIMESCHDYVTDLLYRSVWHWVYLNSLMQLPLILSICTDVTYRCPVILYLFLDSLNCLPVRSMSSFTSIPPAVPVQAAGDAEGDERAAC